MTTSALTKDIMTKETLELLVEDTNTLTQVDIEPPFPQEECLISIHALSSILTPKTLKITGYIKHRNS
jgi:hypothetical protein